MINLEENHNADFRLGMQDCDAGLAHKKGRSTDYDNGYSFKYQQEQIETRSSEANT